MRKVTVLILVLMLAVFNIAFALGDNKNEQDQQQGQIGINKSTNINDLKNNNANFNALDNRNANSNANFNANSNSNSNKNSNANMNSNSNRNMNMNSNKQGQGQGQGQDQGQGQAQGQGQGQGQVSVGQANPSYQSSYESKAYSFSPPALSSNKGMNEGNIYSIFGGIGLSEDSEYVVCIEKLSTIERLENLKYITHEEAVVEARAALLQLKDATKPKRILFWGPKTRGRHVGNLLGLIATDSWCNEDKVNARILRKEIDSKLLKEEAARAKTIDEDLEGNQGNFPGGNQE